MKLSKIIAAMLCVMMTVSVLTGCGTSSDKKESSAGGGKKLSIVTTIFPEYDWVRNILGTKADDADITMLLDSGVDLHSYQPSAEDIKKISTCDVFVYVGGESDAWVKDALKEAVNKNMQVVDLMKAMGDRLHDEEQKEGMQEEKGEEEESGEVEKDEHIWLSLKNARVCCEAVEAAVAQADPDNKAVYDKNLKDYSEKLSALDKEYKAVAEAGSKKTLLFGDRFPFRYLVEDYGLDYYAAFSGCSAESEASFSTVKFLAAKLDELGLKHVMTIEKNDHKIAETIIDNTKNKDQDILTMDSMQSTTADDVDGGANYLGIMKSDLEVLKKALD